MWEHGWPRRTLKGKLPRKSDSYPVFSDQWIPRRGRREARGQRHPGYSTRSRVAFTDGFSVKKTRPSGRTGPVTEKDRSQRAQGQFKRRSLSALRLQIRKLRSMPGARFQTRAPLPREWEPHAEESAPACLQDGLLTVVLRGGHRQDRSLTPAEDLTCGVLLQGPGRRGDPPSAEWRGFQGLRLGRH